MGDEATPIEQQDDGTAAAEGAAGAGSPSIREIVDGLEGFGDPKDGKPADAAPASEPGKPGTGEGDSANPKTDDTPAAPKVEFLSQEQLDKLTLKEVERPSFDWSKLPPEHAKAWKQAIAAVTPERQTLAAERKRLAQERPQKPPQPSEEDEDPTDASNRAIVEKHLGELTGVKDPKLIGLMAENLIFTNAVQLADVPEYSSDETFNNAVNDEIASTPMLMAATESRNPELMASAIRIGSAIVKARADGEQLAKREKDLSDREAKVKALEQELEQERAKLTRGRPTVAGGARGGAAPAKGDSMRDTVESLDVDWHNGLR